MVVNGKEYPLWSQFVENKKKYVGGILEDFGDNMDRMFGAEPMTTTITDIKLEPNGDDSAFFSVVGEYFTCGLDVQHGGIIGGDEGWITFDGYGGHKWRIKALCEKEN